MLECHGHTRKVLVWTTPEFTLTRESRWTLRQFLGWEGSGCARKTKQVIKGLELSVSHLPRPPGWGEQLEAKFKLMVVVSLNRAHVRKP